MKTLYISFFLDVAVQLWLVVEYTMMLQANPGLLVLSLVATITALLGALVTIVICDAKGDTILQTRARRAASWMLLSCLPIWPAFLMQRLELGIGAWQTSAFMIVGAALVLRYVHEGALRWVVPLALAVASLSLLPVAREFATSCVLVAVALGVHAIAAAQQEPS